MKIIYKRFYTILICKGFFTVSGIYSGDFDEFDISCLYILLRTIGNITPHKNGWGNKPDDFDECLSAHIERLRIFRNTLAHSNNHSLSGDEFKEEWSKIHTSIVEVGGEKYHNVVREKLISTDGNSNMSGNLVIHLFCPLP